MCETMEKYINLAVRKERIEKIRTLLEKGCNKEFILSVGYSEDEYLEVEKAEKNEKYLAMIDRSMAEAEDGGFVITEE